MHKPTIPEHEKYGRDGINPKWIVSFDLPGEPGRLFSLNQLWQMAAPRWGDLPLESKAFLRDLISVLTTRWGGEGIEDAICSVPTSIALATLRRILPAQPEPDCLVEAVTQLLSETSHDEVKLTMEWGW